MESNLEKIKRAKTFSEVARIFGYKYYNGSVKKKIIKNCKELYNIDIIKIIEENKKKKYNKCLYCGSLIEHYKKFCNSSCAASYNNTHRIVTDDQKKRTSESLKKYFINHPRLNENRKIIEKGEGESKEIIRLYENVCKQCGKIFYRKRKTTYCSRECAYSSEEVKNKIKLKCKERISNGTFSGWKSRNITSYAEKFWKNVLDNNSITYNREVYVNGYFLDFLIEKHGYKIDLEIDGKQHKYKDRKDSDIKRDKVLKELGYIVYRIEWNSINNENGKESMKKKINDFLSFLSSFG